MNFNSDLLHWAKYSSMRCLFDDLSDANRVSRQHASSFWAKVLDGRHNFPSFNEMTTFRRGMATGIGYAASLNEETEQRMFRLDLGRALAVCPVDFLKEHQESNVGHPYQYFCDGILSSPAGLHNCATAWRILSCVKESGVPNPKRILEIGAGYGGVADILIRVLSPNVLVVCDLPENLFLSFYYLSVNHPQYDVRLVHNIEPVPLTRQSLLFCTPEGIELVREQYELIVNTYSFQEMALDEVRRYFAYINDNMHDDAVFYFLNHFGAAGAKKPSDYPLDMFRIESWGPFPVPQPRFLHRKQHVEAVLRKRKGREWPKHFQDVSETIALLLFAGVNDDLLPVCQRAVTGNLSSIETEYLRRLLDVLVCQSPIHGLEILERLEVQPELRSVNFYLAGLLHLVACDHAFAAENFEKAIESGLSGFAKSRSYAALGLLSDLQGNSEKASNYIRAASQVCPQFTSELEDWQGWITLHLLKMSYGFAFPRLDVEGSWSQTSVFRRILAPICNRLWLGRSKESAS